jgi:hypothetical protein
MVCNSVILPLVRFEVSCIEFRPLTQSIYCAKAINRLSQASKDNKSNNFLPHPVYLYHTGTVCKPAVVEIHQKYFSLSLRICTLLEHLL